MRCAQCQTIWPDELSTVMKFCGACGASLTAASAVVEAQPFSQRMADPGRELRFVTVLFAALEGCTAFAEDRPPDEVARIVGDLLQQLGKAVEKFGGGVDKFLGDAVVATFGLPRPDPSAARNAVRAGLLMQATTEQFNIENGLNLGLRVGIHAGEVMFRAIGGSWTVMGDTVNTASRIQNAAPPGKIWISRPVFEEVRRYFTLFARPVVELKGKKQAVQPYEVVSERQVPFVDQPRFVGRDQEWEQLQQALRRAIEQRQLQVVAVRGPAGVGKSRLVWELRDWVQKQPEVYRVDLVQYDSSERLPSHGLNALIRSRFRLTLEMEEAELLAQLQEGMAKENPLGAVTQEALAAEYFAFVLGFSLAGSRINQLDGKGKWEETFVTIKEWMERKASQTPWVWFVEDVQKGDADTAAFLEWALQVDWAGPVLVVLTAREEDFGSETPWYAPLNRWVQKGWVEELRLREIAPEILVASIISMAEGQIPRQAALHIAEHTEGNPLFATEVVLLLKERGIIGNSSIDWSEVALPGSIREVMEARIERLGQDGKDVAKRGALMGRRFTREAVQLTWERAIEDFEHGYLTLRETETTYEEASRLFAGEKEDVFRHGRLHEAVLARIPHEERLRWLKELENWARHKIQQAPEEHWLGIGLMLIPLIARSREEQGDVWEASLWSEVLGKLNLEAHRTKDAIGYLRQAVTQASGVRRLILSRQAAEAASFDGQHELALECLKGAQDSSASAEQVKTPELIRQKLRAFRQPPLTDWEVVSLEEARLDLDLAQAEILAQTGEVAAAQSLYGEIETRLNGLHSQGATVLWVRWGRSNAFFLDEILSDPLAAAAVFEKMRSQVAMEKLSDEERLAYLYSEGLVEARLGHHEKAMALVDERLRIAQSLNLLKEEANAWVMKGNTASSLGDLETCQDAYQHSLEISRLIGHRRSEAITLFNLSEISVEMGNWELAAQYLEQYQTISRVIGNWLAEAYAPLTLATIAIQQGNYRQAEVLIARSQEIAQKNSWLRLLGIARSLRADLSFYGWLDSHEPTLLKRAVAEYQALEAEGKFEQLGEYASLTLTLFYDGQGEAARLALARGKAMAEPHSEHDQMWIAALEKILSDQSPAGELAWFRGHHHVRTSLLLERLQVLF